MHAEALRVSAGSTAACAPIKPIFTPGFCALIASATLQSFLSEGVEVLMMTWSKSLAMARHWGKSTLCGGQSRRREPGVSAAGCASHVGYQNEVTSRRAWYRAPAPPSKPSNDGGER